MRLRSVDAIRGYAVLIMLLANTVPYTIGVDISVFWRLLFSSAAPIFIFISGFTSQMNFNKPGFSSYKFLKRALQLIFMGAFIDTIFWNILPFCTFDVLYLLGVIQLLLLLLKNDNKGYIKAFLIALIFSAAIYANKRLEYRFEMNEISLVDFYQHGLINFSITNSIRRFLYDGWFPFFPWGIFGILGALFYILKNKIEKYKTLVLLFGVLIFLLFLYFSKNSAYPVRDKYLEIWYPLKNYKIIYVLSVCFLGMYFIFFKHTKNSYLFQQLEIIGKNSLFVYFLHCGIMGVVSTIFIPANSEALNITLLIACILIPYSLSIVVERIKSQNIWGKLPSILKFIFGF